MRLSKCVKYFDSKCAKINAICTNFILTLFVYIYAMLLVAKYWSFDQSDNE